MPVQVLCNLCTAHPSGGGALSEGRVNFHDLLPNIIWQMDVTHCVPFGNLSMLMLWLVLALALPMHLHYQGEMASNAIKALKSVVLIMGVPWAIKRDNGPAYISQQFNDSVGSWKITHTIGIPYDPHSLAVDKHANCTIKPLLAQLISPEAKQDPNSALVEVLFHIKFLNFNEAGLSLAYRYWAYSPWDTPLPLVRWRDPITLQWQPPTPLLTRR